MKPDIATLLKHAPDGEQVIRHVTASIVWALLPESEDERQAVLVYRDLVALWSTACTDMARALLEAYFMTPRDVMTQRHRRRCKRGGRKPAPSPTGAMPASIGELPDIDELADVGELPVIDELAIEDDLPQS